jgi:tetratricopeptide (TPR) repeat protein
MTGNYREALESLETSIGLEPQNPDVWYSKGLALVALDRLDEALTCFEKVMELNPQDTTGQRSLDMVREMLRSS